MAKNRDNMEADRLRSYSSAFSRSVFSNILSYSDFSPLDWLYGESGDKFQEGCSYLDFLSYIYKTLTSSYRCEYVYKNEIINQLLLKKYGTKNTIAFNEFKVGDSIVDIAMMNGESKAFEIKTKLDTPRRLKKQMSDYRKIFNKCYVVVDVSECEYYANHLDEATGIVALSYKRGNIRLDEYRPAKRIEGIDSDVMMKCLRTCEYENIVREYFGELPDVPTYNLFEVCKDQISHIDSAILNCLFLQEIKKRKSPTGYLKDSPKILRQIILSLNLTPKNQETLISKLNNPINNSSLCTVRI